MKINVMKKELIQDLRFRSSFDGAQDYDLCLRALDRLWNRYPRVEDVVCHIPKVLYHWRCHNESTAANPQSKRYAYEAGRKALQDFVDSRGWKAKVEDLPHVGFYRVIYEGGVLSQRKDVAAVGGKKIKGGKLISGAFDWEGKPLYEGLPFCYSGYIHRAVLSQNVAQLDVDTWKVNPELEKMVERFWKERGREMRKTKKESQKALCEYLNSQGYRLYWDPSWKL